MNTNILTTKQSHRLRRAFFSVGGLAASLMVMAAPAQAALIPLYASLSSAQEVAGAGVSTTSAASGAALMTYDDLSGQLSWNINYSSGITFQATPTLATDLRAAHFHGAITGAVGVSSAVAVPICTTTTTTTCTATPLTGTATLTVAQAADLLAGRMYINLHTGDGTNGFPNGEIRGQILRVPAAPTIGAATPFSGHAAIAFTPSVTDGITGNTYTATCVVGTATAGNSATGTTSPIVVLGLTNGTAYNCSVKSSNPIATSAASANVAVTALATLAGAPGAPLITTITPGATQAIIAFTAPVNDGGSAITGYTAACVTGVSAAVTATGSASPLTVTGLTTATAYTCTVKAANALSTSGNAAGSTSAASAAFTTTASISQPGAPTNVTAIAGNASARIAFAAPQFNGGSAITSYTASCVNGSHTVTVAGAVSPLTVTGLTNSTAYTCTVTASHATLTSAVSTASASFTPTVVVLGSIPVTMVAAGNASTSIASLIFSSGVTTVTAGTATATTLTATQAIPAGYTSVLAVDVTSAGTVATGGSAATIDTCFSVPTVTSAAVFATLKVFHQPGGVGAFTDVTFSRDFATKTICARTSSLSPFVVAEPSAAATVTASGSSGGCTLGGGNGLPDPSLPLLALLAAAYVARRRMI